MRETGWLWQAFSALRCMALLAAAWLAIAIAAVAGVMPAHAELPSGAKSVVLVAADGQRQVVGQVEFETDSVGTKAEFKLSAPEFEPTPNFHSTPTNSK